MNECYECGPIHPDRTGAVHAYVDDSGETWLLHSECARLLRKHGYDLHQMEDADAVPTNVP